MLHVFRYSKQEYLNDYIKIGPENKRITLPDQTSSASHGGELWICASTAQFLKSLSNQGFKALFGKGVLHGLIEERYGHLIYIAYPVFFSG